MHGKNFEFSVLNINKAPVYISSSGLAYFLYNVVVKFCN